MRLLNADELRVLSSGFRSEPGPRTDGALVELIESDVAGYRAILGAGPEQPPSAPLDHLLPLMGWLIYEASREAVRRIAAGFDLLDPRDGRRLESELAFDHVGRLADAARRLPWPEFAPRALGAIRAQALAQSERHAPDGYDAAWLLREEAKFRYREYRDSHGAKPGREGCVLALDEVLVQLALAEAGTACRTAERMIGRWAEEFAGPGDPDASRERGDLWIERLFRQLTEGLEAGELALERIDWIERTHGFADRVDEHRLALRAARRDPGITTARAAALLLAFGPEMARLGRRPEGFGSWASWEQDLLRRFEAAYRAIGRGGGPPGAPGAIRPGGQRRIVRARLDSALPKPGYSLASVR